jgi:hypothetical protein
MITMIMTPLGAQYLQAAFAKWRENNLWADEIPWEGIPLEYKEEIQLAARLMMTGGNSSGQVVDSTPNASPDDLAA